jgi:hypothetical protein
MSDRAPSPRDCAATPRDVQDPVVSGSSGQAPMLDVDPRYPELHAILGQAYGQVAGGKGADRHGTPGPFATQPTGILGREGGPAGPWYQAGKKIMEAMRLHRRGERLVWQGKVEEGRDLIARARAEALGAINYAGFGIIALDETPP